MKKMNEAGAIKAVGHPLRLRILRHLDGVTDSPSNMAAEWGEPIGNVSYHARILNRVGAIGLVRTKQVRGAVEHYYTAVYRISPVSFEPVEHGS